MPHAQSAVMTIVMNIARRFDPDGKSADDRRARKRVPARERGRAGEGARLGLREVAEPRREARRIRVRLQKLFAHLQHRAAVEREPPRQADPDALQEVVGRFPHEIATATFEIAYSRRRSQPMIQAISSPSVA